jgi:hypothetical protein
MLACRRADHRPEQLRTTLASMRGAIAQYHAKHGRNPHALPDLVRDGELRMIPADPVTQSSMTWRPVIRENVRMDDFTSGAPAPSPAPSSAADGGGATTEVIDVHSGASGKDSNGRAWSDY